jgi:predicted nucleotidyltransferase
LRSELRALLAGRPDILVALLFGSQARGTAREESDVDVAVLAPGVDLVALAAELGARLQRTVDVVDLSDPGVPLLEAVINDGELLCEGKPGAGATWRARALATLETDRPWFARMRDAWLRHVAERGI